VREARLVASRLGSVAHRRQRHPQGLQTVNRCSRYDPNQAVATEFPACGTLARLEGIREFKAHRFVTHGQPGVTNDRSRARN
jgi:hypothetical protein